MLSRTRVSSAPDFNRIAQAVSTPGIDPRVWSSLAVVSGVPFVDPLQGVFVDVVLLPSQVESTARLGAEYAGTGFGLYLPLADGDEVLVEAPNGDPAEGLVITKRLHSPADPPPPAVSLHPTDLLLFVKPGTTLRVSVSGGGRLLLGGVDATSPVVLGDVLAAALRDLLTTGQLRCGGIPCYADPDWMTQYLYDPATSIFSRSTFTERGE